MIPSAPGSWLKPISEKDKAADKREHCVSVSLTLVSPKILTFISPHDDARIRIEMARTLSTESSCNLIKFVQLGAERIPSCRELTLILRSGNWIYRRQPIYSIRLVNVSLQDYRTNVRPMGRCADIIAFKDTVLSLPQLKAWLIARPNPSQDLAGDCIKPWKATKEVCVDDGVIRI